ncbi:UNVERIFIED_CONTAM: hypothetical protein K2H54_057079 [Gekko kuhli]
MDRLGMELTEKACEQGGKSEALLYDADGYEDLEQCLCRSRVRTDWAKGKDSVLDGSSRVADHLAAALLGS